MCLSCLLKAAEIVERRGHHGHDEASMMMDDLNSTKKDRKLMAKRSRVCRATHNQLEKNRRKHLRDCLHSLRDLIPSSRDVSKVTTLSLLQSARQYIKVLENQDREAQNIKTRLCLEQERLRKQLTGLVGGSISHPSSSNNSPNAAHVYQANPISYSPALSCEEDIIDVENVDNDYETGYGSSSDDTSSTTSSNFYLNVVL